MGRADQREELETALGLIRIALANDHPDEQKRWFDGRDFIRSGATLGAVATALTEAGAAIIYAFALTKTRRV
jgi:predicted amidophosphoribosyltransferase